MAQAYRVRIGDGSVIDLDRDALRSWYEQGLVSAETQVQPPGSRAWASLAQAADLREWRAPRAPVGRSVPARPSGRAGGGAPSRPSGAAEPDASRDIDINIDLRAWARYAAIGLVLAAVGGAVYWTAPWWTVLVFGTEEVRRVRAAASGERRFADETLGLTVDLPGPWLLLRDGHGFFTPPANARLSLADPAAGAFGYLAVDTPSRGFLSLDSYLAQAFEDRRRAEPSLREVRREEIPGRGRRLLATRQAGETTLDEVVSGWKDGWTYYALVVWAPAERASAGAAAAALQEGVTTQGPMGTRLRQAVETVSREVPLLTPAAAEMLMGQSQAQVLEPAEAFRRTFQMTARGLPTLAKDEQREMGGLTTALYATLPSRDRGRLGSYIEQVRAGRATDPAQDQEMCRIVKTAALKLPPSRRLRLQALFEKALTAVVTYGV
jgi:hypothetical protein